MIEVYLGDEESRRYVQTYLGNIRQLYPSELFTLPKVITLEEATREITGLIDGKLFWELVNTATNILRAEYSSEFGILNPKRYYYGIPESTSAVGGFHSKWSVGYHQLYHAGFVVMLNPAVVTDIRVRTAEAVRAYLHDCLHYSTFHSYRRVVLIPKVAAEAKYCEPRVYREQYGFNFRNSEGLSYSDRSLTALVPQAINLNLLMDGIVVNVAASLIKRQLKLTGLTDFDNGIFHEVIGEPFEVPGYRHAQKFFDAVPKPSQVFIEHWGGDEFLKVAFTAMMTGEVAPLKHYFNLKHGEEGAWEKVFMRPEFRL
ncbi:MAG: hypothetical protein M3Q73_02390 [bacterium]|nr:hypothetical protein [bacterium]